MTTAGLFVLALASIAIQLWHHPAYGYFRDELYYLACSQHLAWGYVDHPPLSIFILAGTRTVLGDSLPAIRLAVMLAVAAAIVLTGLLTRELGGGRFAQWLAGLALLVSGTSLAMASVYSMNAFDLLFWVLSAFILTRILRSGDPRLWIPLGVVVGIGLLNKISIGFFVAGILVGLLLTPARRWLASPWAWAGAAISLLIFLPHVLWQVSNGFPTLEFIHNAQQYKIAPMSPLDYLGAQVIQNNPFTAPLWLAGLAYLLLAPACRPYRVLGLAYVTVLAIFLLQQAKAYYLTPAYPMLFAGGALAVERLALGRGWRWLQPVAPVWLLIGGVVIAPLALPLLPPQAYVGYAEWIGVQAPREERHAHSDLPQYLSDRIGWENLVATVARVHAALPDEERAAAVILAGNYGEAGAIDFFGPRHGLPGAVSGHNNYWLWGPGNTEPQAVITVGVPRADLEPFCNDIEHAATVDSPNAMPYETNLPVFICRGLRVSLSEAWARVKRFI